MTSNKLNMIKNVMNCNERTLDLVISNMPSLSVMGADEVLGPVDAHHPALLVSLTVPKRKWRERLSLGFLRKRCCYLAAVICRDAVGVTRRPSKLWFP